ncbi:type III PLP-dependent enzyme [Motiliproteus sp. MSK22-1]|uniref:type III PLP-dependent enzyme n=1 Tax=Motiliproteus sp. MSK22-1 TaxID=1897630 RepID=UPI000978C6A5|nr:type III PLP-dependent enzyme [Motiliproteus sp. MSK22-1]OMH33822.1 diaminopimelate decarboxylase [Motiliproteus sp. MSK22-1]
MFEVPSQAIENYLSTIDKPASAYFYDLDWLRQHVTTVVEKLPANCKMYYAIKANSEARVLQEISSLIYGYEVASAGEIKKVREAVPNASIAFGGPAKNRNDLEYALSQRVELYHLESRLQLQMLDQLAGQQGVRANVLLRINPRIKLPEATLTMGGSATQFGIDQSELEEIFELIPQLKNLDIDGFHIHALSNNLDYQKHLQLLDSYLQLFQDWSRKIPIKQVNVGGGIGINYQQLEQQFDWSLFCDGLSQLLTEYNIGYPVNFECGRFLSANCGYYLTEVIDIKSVREKKFALLRGGNHHFRLPSSWQHNHPFKVIHRDNWPWDFPRPSATNEQITLCGELCTPKDVLASNVTVSDLAVGDSVLFVLAGAYGWHISHHDFLSHPHADLIFINSQQHKER